MMKNLPVKRWDKIELGKRRGKRPQSGKVRELSQYGKRPQSGKVRELSQYGKRPQSGKVRELSQYGKRPQSGKVRELSHQNSIHWGDKSQPNSVPVSNMDEWRVSIKNDKRPYIRAKTNH
ncbi:hypothetical protein SK128_019194 [Halocaridina rubra]|uniref:Uncharacterized protein n=1 Tax=Halocaridina rubra TaxID=373956 RepID=A0AAN9AAS6_HALRR